MSMTHYMELLATNQPWNLIFFMLIPVAFAEAMTVTEFFVVFRRETKGATRTANKLLGIGAGLYFFFAVFLRLLITAIPKMQYRGPADVIAVWSYLLGVIPLGLITLLELGVIGKGKDDEERMKDHFVYLAIFLVIAHVAMVFGMLNPELLGWVKTGAKAMGGM